LGKIFTIVERIEEDRQEEMERAGESHPLRKTLSKPPQITKTNPSVGCHESWRNDFTPPVSFIIGAIRNNPSQITNHFSFSAKPSACSASRRFDLAKDRGLGDRRS
jgi:hypothetical protein